MAALADHDPSIFEELPDLLSHVVVRRSGTPVVLSKNREFHPPKTKGGAVRQSK
jgi:hypothetical protein